jgi:galactokinase
MGSHTDYNLGYVLTLPISRDVWIAARQRTDERVRVLSLDLGAESSFRLNGLEHDLRQPWSDYIRGVAAMLEHAGFPLSGFDAVIQSTVPIGRGLGSSAALECATAVVFQALGGWALSAVDMALLCQRAENEFVGVNCGILDQYTSCLGRADCALLLDCRDLSHRTVPMHRSLRVVICDTGVRRVLASSEYGSRRAQCEEGARRLGVTALREVTLEQLELAHDIPGEVVKRCRFIIEENMRVVRLAEALERGDSEVLADLCAESFRGARDLYEISSPEMTVMMDAMLAGPGVIGARQAGAGFGGCMVAFVNSTLVEAFTATVREAYAKATGVSADIYPVEAATGATWVRDIAG